MLEKKSYSPKGYMCFAYIDNDIKYFKEDYPKDMAEFYEVNTCGDFMSGKEFYEQVNDRCLINYDGSISYIFVDGYRSNLGLCHEGMRQGDFLVDGPTWLDICDVFEVEVVWCNK